MPDVEASQTEMFSGPVQIVAAGFGVDPSHCVDCDGTPALDDATYLTVRVPVSLSISLAHKVSVTVLGPNTDGGKNHA